MQGCRHLDGGHGTCPPLLEIGATFVAAGSDVDLFVNATSKLIAELRAETRAPAQSKGQTY
jgi:hypothetical protein